MSIFRDFGDRQPAVDPGPIETTRTGTESPASEQFPPSRESLEALRALIDSQKIRGTLRIERKSKAWSIEAKFHASLDYDLEITGRSLDEVAYIALDALEQMVP